MCLVSERWGGVPTPTTGAPPFEIPAGFRLASAPTAAQLEYRNAAAAQLVGKCILFNWQHDWQAAGWCLGKITRANTDGRRIVREGVPANFFVYYEIDEEEAKHSLELVEHGHQEVPHAWGTFGQGGGMPVLLHVLYFDVLGSVSQLVRV